jgi:hypothetical protein
MIAGGVGVTLDFDFIRRAFMIAVTQEACALYVATSLELLSAGKPDWFARDVQIGDTAYRRLDPEYYAWLRSRMVLAKKAAAAGHLNAAAFEELRLRFNTVHEWAIQQFGEEQLLAAVRALRAGEYKAPVAEDDGPLVALPRSARSAADHVSAEVVAMVDAISERALSLGWKRERLYATGNGRFDPHRGLIRFLKPDDRIGEVTAQSIEIVRPLPSEVRHSFYNPDVDQPWMKKIGAVISLI